MLEVAGDYVAEDVIFRFIQIITGFENQEPNSQLQLYAAEKVFKLLDKEFVFDNLISETGTHNPYNFSYSFAMWIRW